jgi:DNA-binding transcriptional MerR regulator
LTFKSAERCLMSVMAALRIGEVAKRTGMSAPAIRYYESIGLLRAPERSAAGYRRYPESAVAELLFVRKAQLLGFSLDEIGGILQLSRAGEAPCARVRSLAREHLGALDERIRQLQRFRDQLAGELATWNGRGASGARVCRFIEAAEPDATIPPVNLRLHDRRRGARRSQGHR